MKPILLLLLATLTAQAATFTGKVVGLGGRAVEKRAELDKYERRG